MILRLGRTQVFAATVVAASVTMAAAHDFRAGDITIDHPWSRPAPPAAPVASGYLTLTNNGSSTDWLDEVRSPKAKSAEVHRSLVVDGVASMRPVEGGLAIEPGATIAFDAEKLHIMFNGPGEAFKEGERVPATLVFRNAGTVEVEFAVQRRAGEPSSSEHSEHGSTP